MTMKYIALEATVEFPFSVNAPATGGVSDADAAPPFDVRLQGAAANAAPVYSGTADLLSHGDYPAGQYAAIVAATAVNGFAADKLYTVYVSAAVTTTTGAVIGEFTTSALLNAAGIRTAIGMATANADTQWGATKTAVDTINSDGAKAADVANVDGKLDDAISGNVPFTADVTHAVGTQYKGDGTVNNKLRSTLVS